LRFSARHTKPEDHKIYDPPPQAILKKKKKKEKRILVDINKGFDLFANVT
jgi:hypothetical protein